MSNTEGVIKFQMDFTPAPALPWAQLRELERLAADHGHAAS